MRELEAARFGSLFASPLLEHMWADGAELNAELRERVLEHARRHPGSEQTNVGGWHSEIGRLEFCGSAGERLVRHMREMIEEATLRLYASYSRPPEPLSWILSAWANINRRGDFNNMHTHPGATWSGVYYVDDGEFESGRRRHGHRSFPIPARRAPISSSPSFRTRMSCSGRCLV